MRIEAARFALVLAAVGGAALGARRGDAQGPSVAWRDDLAAAAEAAASSGRLLFVVDIPADEYPEDHPAFLALDRLAFAEAEPVALVHGRCVPVLRAVGATPSEPPSRPPTGGVPLTWIGLPGGEVLDCLVGVYGPQFLMRELQFAADYQAALALAPASERAELARRYHDQRTTPAERERFRALFAAPAKPFDPDELRPGEIKAICSAAQAVRWERMRARYQPPAGAPGAAMMLSMAGHAEVLPGFVHLALAETPLITLPLIQGEALEVFTGARAGRYDNGFVAGVDWVAERADQGKPFLIVVADETRPGWKSASPALNDALGQCWVLQIGGAEGTKLLEALASDDDAKLRPNAKYLALGSSGRLVASFPAATRLSRLQRFLEREITEAATASEQTGRELTGASDEANATNGDP